MYICIYEYMNICMYRLYVYIYIYLDDNVFPHYQQANILRVQTSSGSVPCCGLHVQCRRIGDPKIPIRVSSLGENDDKPWDSGSKSG